MFLTIPDCFIEVNAQKYLQMLLLATKYFHRGKEMSVKSMHLRTSNSYYTYRVCRQST